MTYSYASVRMGLIGRFRDLWGLYRYHATGAHTRVINALAEITYDVNKIQARFGFTVIQKKILDIGPGPYFIQSRYFALGNNVFAIDTDVLIEKFSPAKLLEMIRYNGLLRSVKTIGRKLIGVDETYRKLIMRELQSDSLSLVSVIRGDVCEMKFESASFDMVFSRAVLSHVQDPKRALREIARVLRAGGIAYIRLHLYTSPNGSLDPRLMTGGDSSLYWGHLRGFKMRGNAVVNQLSLRQWQDLFSSEWPECVIEKNQTDEPYVSAEADRLIANGELSNYTRDELLTYTVVAIWQKH